MASPENIAKNRKKFVELVLDFYTDQQHTRPIINSYVQKDNSAKSNILNLLELYANRCLLCESARNAVFLHRHFFYSQDVVNPRP